MCRPRRLSSESDVHSPDPGHGQESDSTELLAVGDEQMGLSAFGSYRAKQSASPSRLTVL